MVEHLTIVQIQILAIGRPFYPVKVRLKVIAFLAVIHEWQSWAIRAMNLLPRWADKDLVAV